MIIRHFEIIMTPCLHSDSQKHHQLPSPLPYIFFTGKFQQVLTVACGRNSAKEKFKVWDQMLGLIYGSMSLFWDTNFQGLDKFDEWMVGLGYLCSIQKCNW